MAWLFTPGLWTFSVWLFTQGYGHFWFSFLSQGYGRFRLGFLAQGCGHFRFSFLPEVYCRFQSGFFTPGLWPFSVLPQGFGHLAFYPRYLAVFSLAFYPKVMAVSGLAFFPRGMAVFYPRVMPFSVWLLSLGSWRFTESGNDEYFFRHCCTRGEPEKINKLGNHK